MKKFPNVIFSIIQSYLEEKEYRNLVNSNKKDFQLIKYETVKFTVAIDLHVNNAFSDISEKGLKNFNSLIQKIQDKNNQMGLRLWKVEPEFLLAHTHIFSGINHLVLSGTSRFLDFDFSIFNGIQKVSLSHFSHISCISSPLIKIRDLSVYCFVALEEITSPLNSDGCLTRLRIERCERLKRISFAQDVPMVNFVGNGLLKDYNMCGNRKIKELIVRPNFTSFAILQHLLLQNIEILKLQADFSESCIDFTLFSHINEVSLWNISAGSKDHYPKFPIFYGHTIDLSGFDLSLWNNQEFLTVKVGIISHCSQLTNFPSFPAIAHLYLHYLPDEISTLPPFPTCRYFKIVNCSNVFAFPSLPKVKDIEVGACPKLIDFSSLDGQIIISFTYTGARRTERINFTALRNVRLLSIDTIRKGGSFNDFDQSILDKDERRILLRGFNGPIDFHGLGNIRELDISGFEDIEDVDGIHDIMDLTIANCSRLKTTRHLKNITRQLILNSCDELEELLDLQNIPELDFNYLVSVKNISGLGNHRVLSAFGVPALEILARQYFYHPNSVPEYHEMFQSISECFISSHNYSNFTGQKDYSFGYDMRSIKLW